MSNIQLFKGGTPQTTFPGCFGQQLFDAPFARRVAAEYARGYFTLGESLQPAFRPYQAKELHHAVVGDVAELLSIPENTLLTSLSLDVDPEPPRVLNASGVGCIADSMDGVTFTVVGTLYDTITGDVVGATGTLAGLLASQNNAAGVFSGSELLTSGSWAYATKSIDFTFSASSAQVYRAGFAYVSSPVTPGAFIPKGFTLVLGVQFASAPTNTNLTFADMAGRISLVVKVEDFQFPLMG
jgi:hypothetical protein